MKMDSLYIELTGPSYKNEQLISCSSTNPESVEFSSLFVGKDKEGKTIINVVIAVRGKGSGKLNIKATDGTYYYVNSGLNLVKFPQIRSAFIFNEGFMSGRGALWNRCIPLLGRHLLLGSGSNLFITDYQQDDYVKKTYSVGWGSFEYDVKPHSFYLCTWMENGLPALICIMGFFLLYIIRGASLYGRIDYKDPKIAFTARLGLGLYIGCIAYMIISLANDSNVCTSPVFWAALGISMSVSKMNH